MQYRIDEQILDTVRKGLEERDQIYMDEAITMLDQRRRGVCFCSAHSSSECLCGSWDGVWDEDESDL